MSYLDQHKKEECPERETKCGHCDACVIAKDLQVHMMSTWYAVWYVFGEVSYYVRTCTIQNCTVKTSLTRASVSRPHHLKPATLFSPRGFPCVGMDLPASSLTWPNSLVLRVDGVEGFHCKSILYFFRPIIEAVFYSL